MQLQQMSAQIGRRLIVALLIASALALATTSLPVRARAQAPQPLTVDQLRNATYPSQFTASKKAALLNGAYSEPAAPGSASLVTVNFVAASIAPEFAAVVLVSSGGGSGSFYTLHVVTNQGGQPVAAAGVLIGDRIKLASIAIVNGQVRLTLTMPGPNDPACCPTLQATQTYGFDSGGFRLLSTTPLAAAPLPAATGSAGLFDGHDAGAIQQLALVLAVAVAISCARLPRSLPRGAPPRR